VKVLLGGAGLALNEIMKDLGQKSLFHVFFLKNDEEKSVKIDEVEDIDFDEIKTHLERGESIFITHGEKPDFKIPNLSNNLRKRLACEDAVKTFSKKNANRPWYFVHT
jgi:hypothetical protein